MSLRRLSEGLQGAAVRRRLLSLCILRVGTILLLLACTLFSGTLGHVYIENICASNELSFHAEDSGTIAGPPSPQKYRQYCYIRLTNFKSGDFLFIQFAPGSYLKSSWNWLSCNDYVQLGSTGKKLCGNLTDQESVIKMASTNVFISFYLDVTDSSEPARRFLLRYIVLPKLRTYTIGLSDISAGFIVSPSFPYTPSGKTTQNSILKSGALLCVLSWTFYEYDDYRCNGTKSNDLMLNKTYFCQSKQGLCLPFQSEASTLSFVFRYSQWNRYSDRFMLAFQGNLEQAVTFCTNITMISVDRDGNGVILSPDYPSNYRGRRECKLNISASSVKVIEFSLDEFYVRYYGNNEILAMSETLKINSNSFIRYRSNFTRTFRLLVNETSPVLMSFTTRQLRSWNWNPKFTVQFTVMSCSMENNVTFTQANLSNTSPFCDGGEGSETFDSKTWMCNPQTGEWLPVNKCRPRVCFLPDLVANGDYNSTSDLLTFNSSIQYTCAEGYSLIGASVLNCTNNATWDGEPPKCIPEPACPDPGPFSLGNYTLLNDSLHTNSTIEYACGTGYTLVGSSILRCSDNLTWDGETPQCILVCNLPDLVANGDYSSDSDLLTFDSSIQYTCAEGYSLIGASVLNCTDNATWDGEPPKCIPDKEDGGSTPLSVEEISGTPLSVEEISGIALGITGFLLLITIIVVILLRRSAQKRKRSAERETTGETATHNTSADCQHYENTEIRAEDPDVPYCSLGPAHEGYYTSLRSNDIPSEDPNVQYCSLGPAQEVNYTSLQSNAQHN